MKTNHEITNALKLLQKKSNLLHLSNPEYLEVKDYFSQLLAKTTHKELLEYVDSIYLDTDVEDSNYYAKNYTPDEVQSVVNGLPGLSEFLFEPEIISSYQSRAEYLEMPYEVYSCTVSTLAATLVSELLRLNFDG